MKKINISPETNLKITAWSLIFFLLALHGFLSFHLEMDWFTRMVTKNFWVNFTLILIVVLMGDRFIPMGFAAFTRGNKTIAATLIAFGVLALMQGGFIIMDVSIQNTSRGIDEIVAADSIYTPLVNAAKKDLARYSALEDEKNTSFRSSKQVAQRQLAYADSMRYARAEQSLAVSSKSRFILLTMQFFFLVGHLYCFHLFKAAGAFALRERERENKKSAPVDMTDLAPYLKRSRAPSKKSGSNYVRDASAKMKKSDEFKDAIREIIQLKESGKYDEGDGRPGTKDASSASIVARTFGLNRAETESLRRYSGKTVDELRNKFHGLLPKRQRATETENVQTVERSQLNGKL